MLPSDNRCKLKSFSVDYEFMNKIGEGTFSDVWLCVHRNTKHEAAAKVLKDTYERNVYEKNWNAISEVNIMTKSIGNHPFLMAMENVYYDYDSGKVVLVMELMKKSLFDIIEEGMCPLSDFRIKTYMYQMLEGKNANAFPIDGKTYCDIEADPKLLNGEDSYTFF